MSPARTPQLVQRNQYWYQLYYHQHWSIAQIAQCYGVTSQNVSLVLRELAKQRDPAHPKLPVQVLHEQVAQRRQERKMHQLLEAMRSAVPCCVCYGWAIRPAPANSKDPTKRTCSSECAYLWRIARYRLDPDAYEKRRMSQALGILARPQVYGEADRRWAKQMIATGTIPPNRRYQHANSEATKAMARIRQLRQANAWSIK